ncbi:MAG: molybdopterin oxidoreductase [Wenzhouxiangella sp.]|nr:MAG: molybdopterin oxidoreductase [Wenzhouxiangella sp.]
MNVADLTFQSDVAHWSWTIALFLWFVGIAGMGSVAYYFSRKAPLAITILAAMVIGLLLVFSHLTRWWNLPISLFYAVLEFSFNFQSWMFWGFLILGIHVVLAAVVVLANLPFLQRYWFLRWAAVLNQSNLFLGLFAFVGFMATVYSGFLISTAAGVPLWNTALIPVLWVISASVATVAVIELFYVFGWAEEREAAFGLRLGMGLDVMKLLAIVAFIHISLTVGTMGAQIGAERMFSGDLAVMTWVGVIGIGIFVPLVIGAYTLVAGKKKPLLVVSAVAALSGVLFLRAAVLLAGVWEPLVI